MENAVYSEKVIEHFKNPHNVGFITDYDGAAKVGDPGCGDSIILTVKINDDDIIEDIKYYVYGCPAAIATSSAVSCLAIGKTVQEALSLENKDVVDFLDALPEDKVHCSLLGIQGLRNALAYHIFYTKFKAAGMVKDKKDFEANFVLDHGEEGHTCGCETPHQH